MIDGMPASRRTHLGLSRSFQLPRPFGSLTLADNVRVPLLSTVARRQGGLVHGPHEMDQRCLELLAMVGLESRSRRWPRDLTQVDKPPRNHSSYRACHRGYVIYIDGSIRSRLSKVTNVPR